MVMGPAQVMVPAVLSRVPAGVIVLDTIEVWFLSKVSTTFGTVPSASPALVSVIVKCTVSPTTCGLSGEKVFASDRSGAAVTQTVADDCSGPATALLMTGNWSLAHVAPPGDPVKLSRSVPS